MHISIRMEEEAEHDPFATEQMRVERSISTTGRAMFGAALTTAGGFSVLNLSSLLPLRLFGQAFVVAITLALLASLVILPASTAASCTLKRRWRRPNWVKPKRPESRTPVQSQQDRDNTMRALVLVVLLLTTSLAGCVAPEPMLGEPMEPTTPSNETPERMTIVAPPQDAAWTKARSSTSWPARTETPRCSSGLLPDAAAATIGRK